MADQFAAAQAAAADQKRALLAAMATGGTAAADAYKAAQADTSAARQSAVQGALAAAAQRGAPAELQSQLQATISAPFDRQNANLSQAAASRAADMAQRGTADAAYFDQASAAAPVMRAATDHLLAIRRAQYNLAHQGFGGTGKSEAEIKAAAVGKASHDLAAADAEAAAAHKASTPLAEDAMGAAHRLMGGDGSTPVQSVDRPALDAANAAEHKRAAAQAALDQANAMPVHERNQQAALSLFPRLGPDLAAGIFPEPTLAQRVAEARLQAEAANVDEFGVPRLPAAPPADGSAAAVKASADYDTGVTSARNAALGAKTYDEWVKAFAAANPDLDNATLIAIVTDGKKFFPTSTSIPGLAP